MNKIAILSDIHANLPALEAVLCDVEQCGAGRIVFLGDIIGYGASPAECVRLVRGLGGHCVKGNHDFEMGIYRKRRYLGEDALRNEEGFIAGLIHAARTLPEQDADWLAKLPFTDIIKGAYVAHGSLDDQEAFDYIDDAETAKDTLELLARKKYKIGFFGHTHQPIIFNPPQKYACNIEISSCRVSRFVRALRLR